MIKPTFIINGLQIIILDTFLKGGMNNYHN